MSNSTLIREENDTYLGKTLLNTSEARKFLGVSESMLDKLCANSVLPYYNGTDSAGKTKGRLRFFKVVDLIAWMTAYPSGTVSIGNKQFETKTQLEWLKLANKNQSTRFN